MLFRAGWLGLSTAVVTLLAPGCRDISGPRDTLCGNGLVEASNGEDCDRTGDAGCYPPGNPNECRFSCDPTADASGCPFAHDCGADGVCRASSGAFGETLTIDATNATSQVPSLIAVDMDGDGADELVAYPVGVDSAQIWAFDGRTAAVPYAEVAGLAATPISGDANADGREDLVVVHSVDGDLEIDARTQGPGARFEPVVFASFGLDLAPPIRVLDASPLPSALLAVHDGTLLDVTNPAAESVDLAGEVDALARRISVGALIDDAEPSQEIMVAWPGSDRVWTFQTTGGLAPLGSVTLAPARVGAGSVHVVDVDLDGQLDAVVQAEDDSVRVAYGRADGSFASDPSVPDGDDSFAATPLIASVRGELSDAAHIDDDADLDGVSTLGIHLSSEDTCGDPPCIPFPFAGAADDARFVDIDGDGRTDVVATSVGESPSLWIGRRVEQSGVPYVWTAEPLAQAPGRLVVDDFDGDLVGDAAFALAGESGGLGLLFGGAPPQLREPLALGAVLDVAKLDVRAGTPPLDDGARIVTVLPAASNATTVAYAEIDVTHGRSYRAPLVIETPSGGVEGVLMAALDGPGESLTLLSTTGNATMTLGDGPLPSASVIGDGVGQCGPSASTLRLDVDDDGDDELVALEACIDVDGVPAVGAFVLDWVPGQGLRVVSERTSLPGEPSLARGEAAPRQSGVFDFTGEGRPDAFILGRDEDGVPTLVVYQPGSGLELREDDYPVEGTVPELFDVVPLAIVGETVRIVVSTSRAALASDPSTGLALMPTEGDLRVYDLDLNVERIELVETLTDTGSLDEGSYQPRLVRGDFDGDGVADLASAGRGEIRVRFGVPVLD